MNKIIADSDVYETLNKLVKAGVEYPKLEHIAYRLDGKGSHVRKIYNERK